MHAKRLKPFNSPNISTRTKMQEEEEVLEIIMCVLQLDLILWNLWK